MFNDFKIISKLMILITIFVIGFVLFGVVAYQTIDSIKINGKMYNEIVSGKDLVADILPPPEYIIESYLTALQLSKETAKTKIENLINYEAQLKKEYDTRHDVWVSELPAGDIKKTMIEGSYKPA
ncbi:MAG TPA: methyl-accepting chemotaxis protein, partial [Clostridium sp.]